MASRLNQIMRGMGRGEWEWTEATKYTKRDPGPESTGSSELVDQEKALKKMPKVIQESEAEGRDV